MGQFSKNENTEEQENMDVNENKSTSNEDGIKTELSFHPDWDLTVQEKYVFQFNHQKLPLLKPEKISVNGINLYEYDDGFVVSAFLSSSVSHSISIEVVDLVLVNEEYQPLARKSFEMDLFGELPSNTSRPWRFLFENDDKLVDEIPTTGWKLVFELKKKVKNTQALDLEESWQASLSDEQKQELENIVNNLPPLKEGEVNFMGLEANLVTEKGLAVVLLIRNGSDRSISIKNLPLAFEDASQKVVAQAGFQLNNLEVKAQTCKPWTFVFPESSFTKEDFDLSSWKSYVPQSASVDIKQS